MTPAEEIVLLPREYGHSLYICPAVDRLERHYDAKINYEARKGLIMVLLAMLIALVIALTAPRAQAQKQIQFQIKAVIAPGWKACSYRPDTSE